MSGTDPMNLVTSDVKLTYDDFVLFPDDGQRHELIDVEHVVTPPPNIRHQEILGNLHWLIRSWLESHAAGKVFFAPFDVVLSMFDVVEPDLLYLSKERAAAVLTPKHARWGSRARRRNHLAELTEARRNQQASTVRTFRRPRVLGR
jgi:Uma2 family endonuclease